MKDITFQQQFKRDLRKNYLALLTPEWAEVLHCLSTMQELPPKYLDHPLKGHYVGFRECHIKPDLLLIYDNQPNDFVQLVRIGSHSELFGKKKK
ncbi:MAG: type II toxin-antitoxin system YafQ family toxin [Neisseriaceae bacterium]|nr:type II toxin-antitoxin system YafQ family toxin [Neisseriaceae bacterium]MBR5676280.1 type II toxin-antitoxin system YafQ family toxin [Neisseriaceae bacterium]